MIHDEESFDKIMPFVVGFTAACLAVVYVVLFCIIIKLGFSVSRIVAIILLALLDFVFCATNSASFW